MLYDGECGLCDRAVLFVLKRDKKAVFLFAPLQGQTARRYLSFLPDQKLLNDSVILICDYGTPSEQLMWRSKAVFKVLWLLGGCWRLIGWLSYGPSWLFDWLYRIVARYRHNLFSQRCLLPEKRWQERFLP